MSRRKNRPPATNSNNEKKEVLTEVSQTYSGPIPPPRILQEFNLVIPDAAEKILSMAEENGRHQREMERLALTSAVDTVKRGQNYGLIIGLSALATSGYALWLGYESAAMTIGGFTIVGLVTVFVTGRNNNQ